jgi:hypothetical protein
VLRHLRVAHAGEELGELLRLGMGELDELEAVRAGWVGFADLGGRRVVREGAHGSKTSVGRRKASRPPFLGK